MAQIEIKIKEKDKKGKKLTLFNFRDEVVNFMYKKTVADSSRDSMKFFVLFFFLSLKIEGKTLLMKLFDDNIENLKKLNGSLNDKGKLERGDYRTLVKENNLENIFKYDIFFILLSTILEYKKNINTFDKYFENDSSLKKDFTQVVEKYNSFLNDFNSDFKESLITDDRYDEFGEYHDLSKSVYRTIQMRTSRNLDLQLHKQAEVKRLTSQSPVIFSIIQHIDTGIIFNVWDAYNIGKYVSGIWDFANQNIPSNLLELWLVYKLTDGKKNKKEKKKKKAQFDLNADHRTQQQLLKLVEILTSAVIKSNDHLINEINNLKKEKKQLESLRGVDDNLKKIENISEKIEKLENIEIEATKIDIKK